MRVSGSVHQIQSLSGNYILVGAFDAINNKPINNIAMISSQ